MWCSAILNFGHYLMDSSMLLQHVIYTLAFICILAIDVFWFTDDAPMKLPSHFKDVITKLQALAVFLLAFYVNSMIGRWWRLRTAAVEAIQGANCNIAAQLGIVYVDIHHQCHEQHVLDTVLTHISNIRRYSATSLAWIFKEYGQHGFNDDNLQDMGFVTPGELAILNNLPRHTQPEYLWSVIGTECAKIFEEMLEIETFDAYYRVLAIEELNHSWLKGRGGVGLIKEHLSCQMPFYYATLMSFLVSMNNTFIFIVYAAEMGATVHSQGVVGFLVSTLWVIVRPNFLLLHFLALVFNLLASMAARCDNPFDEGRLSFPGWRYVHQLLEDFEVMANMKPDQHGSSGKVSKHDTNLDQSKPFGAASSSGKNSELKFRPRASQSAKNIRHFG